MGSLRDELTELLGEEGLAALSAARGGQRVYIPGSVRAGHWLAEALGPEAAERLAFHYGGIRIDVPSLAREARDARIRDLRRRGWSLGRIASASGLSRRHLRSILRGTG